MHGVAFDIYRIGNPYGPRQPAPRPQGVIATWMRAILDGRELQVYGDAGTLRDYVFIDDVAFLMTRSLQDCHASALYNIGTGQGISPLALIEVLRSVVDRPFEFRAHPRRPCDNPAIVLDGRRLLSYFPGFTYTALEEGVARTWRAFKAGPQPS
jgi:UDP-glucose 4-epimerase